MVAQVLHLPAVGRRMGIQEAAVLNEPTGLVTYRLPGTWPVRGSGLLTPCVKVRAVTRSRNWGVLCFRSGGGRRLGGSAAFQEDGHNLVSVIGYRASAAWIA